MILYISLWAHFKVSTSRLLPYPVLWQDSLWDSILIVCTQPDGFALHKTTGGYQSADSKNTYNFFPWLHSRLHLHNQEWPRRQLLLNFSL